jgi:hypothetical protein
MMSDVRCLIKDVRFISSELWMNSTDIEVNLKEVEKLSYPKSFHFLQP